MQKLYRFFWDIPRMGIVESVFIEDDKRLKTFMGEYLHFGEILGKHSEIYGCLEEKNIEILSDNQDVIKVLSSIFSPKDGRPHHDCITISGYNPVKTILEAAYWDDDKKYNELMGRDD